MSNVLITVFGLVAIGGLIVAVIVQVFRLTGMVSGMKSDLKTHPAACNAKFTDIERRLHRIENKEDKSE